MAAKAGARVDRMAYRTVGDGCGQLARQDKPQAPQESTEKLADPFADTSPTETPPLCTPAEVPCTNAAGNRTRNGSAERAAGGRLDVPPENPPQAEPPATEPRQEQPRQERPYYGDEPPSPRRSAGPRSRHRILPGPLAGCRVGMPNRRAEFVPMPEPSPSRATAKGRSTDSACRSTTMSSSTIACHARVGLRQPPDATARPPCTGGFRRSSVGQHGTPDDVERGAVSLPPLVTSRSQGEALNNPNLKILSGDDGVARLPLGGHLNIGTCFNGRQTLIIGAACSNCRTGPRISRRVQRIADPDPTDL